MCAHDSKTIPWFIEQKFMKPNYNYCKKLITKKIWIKFDKKKKNDTLPCYFGESQWEEIKQREEKKGKKKDHQNYTGAQPSTHAAIHGSPHQDN